MVWNKKDVRFVTNFVTRPLLQLPTLMISYHLNLDVVLNDNSCFLRLNSNQAVILKKHIMFLQDAAAEFHRNIQLTIKLTNYV